MSINDNNTASDGSLTTATEGRHSLNGQKKEHSGRSHHVGLLAGSVWEYRSLLASSLESVAGSAAILTSGDVVAFWSVFFVQSSPLHSDSSGAAASDG